MSQSSVLANDNSSDEETRTVSASSSARIIKKRGKAVPFELDRVCANEAALSIVAQEACWGHFGRDRKGLAGQRSNYRCNKVLSRDPVQCESSLYLLYHATDQLVSIYRSTRAHTHQNNPKVLRLVKSSS